MSTDVVTLAVKENARALSESPVLLDASTALATIPEALTIASDAEDAAWGDVAKKATKGAKHVESALTDLFRPMKAFEKLLRDHFRTAYVEPLTKGVWKIDRASLAYRNKKADEAREAQRVAEAAAALAAKAALAEAEERREREAAAAAAGVELAPEPEPEFEDAPGVAQVIAPVVEKIARSEETATFEVRTLKCSLEGEREARATWARAFLFDEKACLAEFKAENMDDPSRMKPVIPDAPDGILIGGVRFYNEVRIQRRDR